ncbi:MAG: thrombospondin type 3 repeat-containing protein [Polyangiaceae bacterium]|jgi:thrombospondin type 3 repeat protein
MRSRALGIVPYGVVALLASAPSAHASRSLPRNIQSDVGLNYQPPCSICHQYGKTGDGTAIEPFAWSMRARGLTGSRKTLTPALDADESDRVDSDGDGIPDIEELRNGTDPNSPANDCIIPDGTAIDDGQCSPGGRASPQLGCSVQGLPGSAGWGLSAEMAIAALVALSLVRRARGHRSLRSVRGRRAP